MAGASSEVVEVSITSNLEQWTAMQVNYTYIAPYNISEVTPFRGPKQGGTNITITGFNLQATDGLYCRFDSVYVNATQINSTTAVCTSPASASSLALMDDSADSASFAITYNQQEFQQWMIGSTAQTFTYDNETVYDVAPACGQAVGGTSVVVYTSGVFSPSDALVLLLIRQPVEPRTRHVLLLPLSRPPRVHHSTV